MKEQYIPSKSAYTYVSLIFIALMAVYIFSDFRGYDPDLWGHLVFGKYIITTMTVPLKDLMSYIPTKELWVNHEWFSEVTFFLIFKYFGSQGLFIFKVLISLAVILICYKVAVTKTQRRLLLLSLFFISILAYAYGTAVRPQLFTYLIFTFVLVLLETSFDKPQKLFWVLPVLTMMSANYHGGVAAVLLLIVVYILCKLCLYRKQYYYIFLPVLCFLSTFINPYGIDYWSYLVKALMMKRTYIGEWESVPWDFIHFLPFKILVIFTLGLLLYSVFQKMTRSNNTIHLRQKIVDSCIILLYLYFAFKHSRHIPLFVICILILLPKYFELIVFPVHMSFDKFLRKTMFLFMVCAIPLMFYYTFFFKPYDLIITEKFTNKYVGYPVSAVHFIQKNHLKGNILCFFDWGEFLIWNLYPACKVSFDGRFETVYTDQYIQESWNFLKMGHQWEIFLTKYDHDMVLLPKNFQVVQMLTKSPHWRLVHLGEESALFLKIQGKYN